MCMKIIFTYILIFLMSSCYIVLENNKDISDKYSPILDSTVFLPDENFRVNDFSINNLCQVWVNSRESDNSIIWRPNTYIEYPPSRFREKIVFNKNGEYKKLILSPNDAHSFMEFRWRLSKNQTNRIFIYNSKGEKVESITISKLDSVSLEFKQL